MNYTNYNMDIENEIETLSNFRNLTLNNTQHGYPVPQFCYVYWNQYLSIYTISTRKEIDSIEIEVDLDLTVTTSKLYYGKIHYYQGRESIVYVSNNKQTVCEFILNEFEIDINDGTIYYFTGEHYKCKFNCIMNTRQDIINCMMIHNTDEYGIFELIINN
jgi:hypothetical protein